MFVAAKITRRDAINALRQLLCLVNPFSENGCDNYTRLFFNLQWQNQVNHLKQVSDEDAEQQKRLTKLIEK